MPACLSFEEILEELGTPQLSSLTKVGESFPDANAPGACEAFVHQVRLVEGFITQSYALAVSITKKTENLNEIAEVWKEMAAFCDEALKVLSTLVDKYPYCGTPELYNLALDYRQAADVRRQGVSEEIECQKTDLPKGLFPALN